MEISVCANSDIKRSVDTPLMLTLTTTEDLASEFKQLRFCPCMIFCIKLIINTLIMLLALKIFNSVDVVCERE